MRNKSWLHIIIPVLVVIAPFVGTAVVVPYLINNYSGLADSLSLNVQLLIWVCAAVVIGMGLFPSTLTAIIAGFFYGWQGFWVICFVYMMASVIGYGIALANKGFFSEMLTKKKKVGLIVTELKKKPFLLISLLRISPVLPFAWCNYLLGILEIPFSTYFYSTLVGMLPRTILSVWVGVEIVDLLEVNELNDQVIYKIGGIVLLLLSSFGLGFLGNKVFKKVSDE